MGSGGEQKPSPPRSVFDLPPDFFDHSHPLLLPDPLHVPDDSSAPSDSDDGRPSQPASEHRTGSSKWTCNTCGSEFESLLDQRSHFKSDLHRLNIKLQLKGKNTIKEEDFDDMGDDSLFEECDISSISGSEEEAENEKNNTIPTKDSKQKLYIKRESGETIFLWSCLLFDEYEILSFEKNSSTKGGGIHLPGLTEEMVIHRLKSLLLESRGGSHLRIVLLVQGGHFAGCVFDGNNAVAHKTFHRYVVRAKAGKKQSAKDATGRAASSAGSSLRRYNEAALKKEIQELLLSWKAYFASSACILIHAPSKNSQLLFDGENPILVRHKHAIRHVPLTVRRPTLKEAKRVYNQLTQVTFILNEDKSQHELKNTIPLDGNQENASEELKVHNLVHSSELTEDMGSDCQDDIYIPKNGETMGLSTCMNEGTRLHDVAKSGNAEQTLKLLEEGLDPTIKDSRGRTPYMVAKEKEIRNIFRRFMASNPDKWDWHAANVPSALTKEMEDSQAQRQAEKDAKRKAKAKELKKLRKAKEKAQAAKVESGQADVLAGKSSLQNQPFGNGAATGGKGLCSSNLGPALSNEEERKRALDVEREKRAAAAERRIAALKAMTISQAPEPSNQSSVGVKGGASNGNINIFCSCCNASLAGKIPFHRYNYKYCSTTCMHVHREMLEDG